VHESGLAKFDHNEGRFTGCRQEDKLDSRWTSSALPLVKLWNVEVEWTREASAWGPTCHVDRQTITVYNNVKVLRISSHLLYAYQVHVLVVLAKVPHISEGPNSNWNPFSRLHKYSRLSISAIENLRTLTWRRTCFLMFQLPNIFSIPLQISPTYPDTS
jgi:hypothetical protein